MFDKILAKLGNRDDFNSQLIRRALSYIVPEKEKETLALVDLLIPLSPDEDMLIVLLLRGAFNSECIDEEAVKENFGPGVLKILDGLNRLEGLNYEENDRSSQMEVLRKMFLVMAKDIRVVILGLVSRLYFMSAQVSEMSDKEKVLLARETIDLYVPIASRLGIYTVKTQLEDLAFMYTSPEEYEDIHNQINALGKSCAKIIDLVQRELEQFFRNKGVDARISGRIKGVYSIYKKMRNKGFTSVDDLFDVFAMRIIVPAKKKEDGTEDIDHLYAILGMIHSEWKPMSKRFKDYIAVPKPNGYRSLHTVVLGLAPRDIGRPVEIQIRDSQMHKDAEYGVASHWLYKHKGNSNIDALEAQTEWIRGLEEIRNDSFDKVEMDIFSDRIFVLTPRGEVKDLPFGSCPIDFAYAVHSDIGNRCVMAKVDGKVVPLNYELQNGEVVSIITNKNANPKVQWLSFVKSGFAGTRIKTWLSSLNKDNNLKEGKRLLNSRLARIGKSVLDQNYSALKEISGKRLTLAQRESLLEEIGKGGKLVGDIIRKIYPYEKSFVEKVEKVKPKKVKKKLSSGVVDIESEVLVGGEGGLPIKFAACCKPKKGERILGYVTRGNTITIHRSSCHILDSLIGERIVFADWKSAHKNDDKQKYRFTIRLLVSPRVGLIKDLTSIISSFGINIVDIQIRDVSGGLISDSFILELENLDHIDRLLDKLESVDAVIKVSSDKGF